MIFQTPSYLLALSICLAPLPVRALPDLRLRDTWATVRALPRTLVNWPSIPRRADTSGINFNPNGSAFLWVPEDTYAGKTFFDNWTFFNQPDLTNGLVTYVDQQTAIDQGYIFVEDDGTVIMKADDTTVLPLGQNRSSVRISSTKVYNGGLFILDLNRAPWGCAIWPAFWTVGDTNWPNTGEIDILEGVHDNEHNQITWHTSPGCMLDPNATFTGSIVNTSGVINTVCNGNVNDNSGCAVTEWSRASYGPLFEAQGGGILAMKWDENDISVWSFFRAAIPTDVTKGAPNPSLWGEPSAILRNTMCDIESNFTNHVIVFDITFCGDWAGNSYATSGCPGTCPERLMDPTNFVNASWSINSLQVYSKLLLNGNVSVSASARDIDSARVWGVEVLLLACAGMVTALGALW
ncbi:glycoside hydrolase family 16 protein [Hypholoma sublateritium FD-334 SS-4]|uniref:Glycoside hydrolase family 16 protein n=1 Tax=Hypholoma sublateritium (strain FD-334 SS-4) TaxID=945553 RepID=A0A0D2NS24_HYPSF|nr:glycoside hydrolase family 16 protein [Hypholoma sublateritium FD-334 SS-4]